MVNTHLPFIEELQDVPQTTITKKNKKITSIQKRGVAILQVLSSLAPRHTETLQLLVTMQQNNANNVTPWASLKKECTKKMITKSDGTLRDILNELSDHGIINSTKDEDGNECLYVPSQVSINEIINFKRTA